jgi:flagellar hook assembly protein FlgD
MLFTYTQITDADDPVAPPPQGKLKVYPNPFKPQTAISYKLETVVDTEVSVYNLKGQKVRVLASGSAGAGDHTLTWNGKDDQGRELAAGIYLIRLQAGKHSSIVKAVLQK